LFLSVFLLTNLNGQKEAHFDVGKLHNHYSRNIIESDDGHIWTIGDREIIRHINGKADLIPFVEKMGLDFWKTNVKGNLYVRDTKLFFPIKDTLYAYDYVAETSRVVWTTPDGGEIGFFVNAQDDERIWIINFRDDSNEVFYSKDGLSFGEPIYDLNTFLEGKRFDTEYDLRAHDGRLYIHPMYHGLLVIDTSGNEIDLPMPASHKLDRSKHGITWRVDNRGTLWKLEPQGSSYYDEQAKDFFIHPATKVLKDHITSGRFDKKLPTRIPGVLVDKLDRMWLTGDQNFIICIDHKKEEIYDFQEDLRDKLNAHTADTRRIILDINGNIWVIIRDGTLSIKPKISLFERYHYNDYKPSNSIYEDYKQFVADSIYRILESSRFNSEIDNLKAYNGYIYYAHERAIHRINPKTRQHEMLPFVNTWINDYLIYNNKLFTVDKKAVSIDLETLELTELPPPPFTTLTDGLPFQEDQFICKVQLDHDGNQGLFIINGQDWSIEKQLQPTYQGRPYYLAKVNQMVMVNDSILLLNDETAIWHLNMSNEVVQKMNVFMYEDGDTAKMSAPEFRYLGQDLNEDIIVASNKDFVILDIDTWFVKEHLSFDGKMNNDYTHRIIPVDGGYWISTFEQILHYSTMNCVTTIINEENGYKYRELGGDFILPSGEIILGTANGLAIFNQEEVLNYKNSTQDSIPLKLISYNYFSKNKDQNIHRKMYSNVAHEIKLSHNDRQLELDVQLMDLAGAEDHYYSYKIDGYIDQWTDAVQNNKINLFGLQSGKYDIMVRASKSLGVWSKEALLIKLHVSQAWYKRWWSYLAYTILVFGTGYALYRYRLHQIRRYEKLRTRISSDLHDDVGTILSSVAMQSEFLSQDAPKDKVEWFEDLSNLSREAMSRMRDTVWAIDSRKDNMESLVDRMQDYLSEMNQIDKFKINLHLDISKRSEKLPPDIRQNVYLIFKEAVNNAFKYSNGNQISIHLHRSPKEGLHLNIKDNGKVDEKNIKTSGTGLCNMKMRSERIKGNLEILTNDGFEIDLQV
jgi:signal transduction histidine kinase